MYTCIQAGNTHLHLEDISTCPNVVKALDSVPSNIEGFLLFCKTKDHCSMVILNLGDLRIKSTEICCVVF